MLRSLLVHLVVVAMVPCGAAFAGPQAGGAESPQPAPVRSAAGSLVLSDLAGQRVSLADLQGEVVVLNFWATWCEPCVKEMPLLAELATRYKDRGIVVVAASVDDEDARPAVEAIAELLGETVQVWVGASLVDMDRLQLGSALPATAVLDRNGVIVVTKRGALQPGALDGALDALLESKPATPKLGGAVEAAVPSLPSSPTAGAAVLSSPPSPAAVEAPKAAPVEATAAMPATDIEEHECEDHEHAVDDDSGEVGGEHRHDESAASDGSATAERSTASRVPS